MKYKGVISIGQNSSLLNETPHTFLQFQERRMAEKAKQELARLRNRIAKKLRTISEIAESLFNFTLLKQTTILIFVNSVNSLHK